MKIAGLRQHYFKTGWNLFDLVLVLTSIIGIIMEDFMPNFPISPTLLRVLRVFRIGRILRLIRVNNISVAQVHRMLPYLFFFRLPEELESYCWQL